MYFWPDSRDARLLVNDAGMDGSRITWDEPPALRWQSIISEAEKQNTLQKLVPILLARYPDNAQLQNACNPFEAAEPIKAIPSTTEGAGTQVPDGAVLVKKFEADAKAESSPLQAGTPSHLMPVTLELDEAAATIGSLRMVAIETERRLTALEEWRKIISTMSSADLGKKPE